MEEIELSPTDSKPIDEPFIASGAATPRDPQNKVPKSDTKFSSLKKEQPQQFETPQDFVRSVTQQPKS